MNIVPFEKNRYYLGKLLTSVDFQAEQDYINSKRQFMNSLCVGSGVLCGLAVYNLDDSTIMVESGAAIDSSGREIVLQSSVVRKLSAIDGFSDIKSKNAVLCVRYSEDAVSPLYAPGIRESGSEYEPNRIREGYTLFLMDKVDLKNENALLVSDNFLNSMDLYVDDDFLITVSIPAVVPPTSVKLVIGLKKLSSKQRTISVDCVLQIPAFVNEAGEHEIHFVLNEGMLSEGELMEFPYFIKPTNVPIAETVIIVKMELTKIIIGGKAKPPVDNFMLKTSIVQQTPDFLIDKAVSTLSLEERAMQNSMDYVPLACLNVLQVQKSYVIESIDCDSVCTYIYAPAGKQKRRLYQSYFSDATDGLKNNKVLQSDEPTAPKMLGLSRAENYATGVLEIPLGTDVRKGSILFSDEIMHGLGKGNVYVQVGVEYVSEDKRSGSMEKNTIYGNQDLFADEKPPITFAELAVKVLPDRGSFIVAARLLRPTPYVIMSLRYTAIRIGVGDDQSRTAKMAGKSISAVTPTVVLASGESHYFDVRFKNMEPTSVAYELTDTDAGTISSDGIYTAPSHDGVFEIRIHCTEMPLIVTYAYAIVKKP